jgi:hypothetical protein
MEEISTKVNGLDKVPERYHHFFLDIEGLDFVEYTSEPELRFTLYFFEDQKIVFWYNNRIETKDACSIIRPYCHIQNSLREARIEVCRNRNISNI